MGTLTDIAAGRASLLAANGGWDTENLVFTLLGVSGLALCLLLKLLVFRGPRDK